MKIRLSNKTKTNQNMVKKDPFKDKPKAPNREQIVADLSSASMDDVVFQHQFDFKDSLAPQSQSSKEEISDHSEAGHGPNTGHGESTDRVKINKTYEQVTKLIQLHTQLSSEPTILNEKYEHLEKLGQDVSDSISELKTAADSIVKKAANK